jgi:hypothetical protein
MIEAFNGDPSNDLYSSLALISSVISSFFALVLILLIRRVNDWTPYTYLLYGMSWLQFMYDLAFFNSVVYVGDKTIMLIANTLTIYAELSVTLLTNVISVIALYIVAKRQSMDLLHNIPRIFYTIGTLSLINVICFYIAIFYPGLTLREMINSYLIIRSGSMCFNILCSMATLVMITKSGSFHSQTAESRALRSFGYRMFCYPAVQIVSRIALLIYDVAYSYKSNPQYDWTDDDAVTASRHNQQQFILLCLFVVVTPLASLGFFLIFLLTQPKAYPALKQMLPRISWFFSSFDHRKNDNNQIDRKTTVSNFRSTESTMVQNNSSFASSGGVGGAHDSIRLDVDFVSQFGRNSDSNSIIKLEGNGDILMIHQSPKDKVKLDYDAQDDDSDLHDEEMAGITENILHQAY